MPIMKINIVTNDRQVRVRRPESERCHTETEDESKENKKVEVSERDDHLRGVKTISTFRDDVRHRSSVDGSNKTKKSLDPLGLAPRRGASVTMPIEKRCNRSNQPTVVEVV